MTDHEILTGIVTRLDAMIGARTNGLQNEVPPGGSIRPDDADGEHGKLGHDFRLAGKYLTAIDIGRPGIIDRAEFDRLVAEYGRAEGAEGTAVTADAEGTPDTADGAAQS